MNNKAKLAITVIVAAMASLAANAVTLTYEQAVQRVKAQRVSQNLNCDSVNFYAAQTGISGVCLQGWGNINKCSIGETIINSTLAF